MNVINPLKRFSFFGSTFGGKRNMSEALGYINSPTSEEYIRRYERQDIAQRIVNAYPNAVWNHPPSVESDTDTQGESEFEKKFIELSQKLKLFNIINRADKLSGLGRYSVIYVGLNDINAKSGVTAETEAGKFSDINDILFMAPFSEANASVTEYVNDTSDPRYGLPKIYTLTTGGYGGDTGSSVNTSTMRVHHSRIIHIAEGTLENETFGTPRLQPILNRLDDLEKVVGGSSEIYWLNGRGGLHLNADKDTEIANPEKLSEHIETYAHELTRVIKTKGISLNPIEQNIHDPSNHVSVILDLISGATGIPKRILTGSERGELASSQDENNWQARVDERRNNYCEPLILRPIIDYFINIGILKSTSYKIVWPELFTLSQKDKAEIALKTAQAISAYMSNPESEMVMPIKQFVEDVLGQEYREDDIAREFTKDENE